MMFRNIWNSVLWRKYLFLGSFQFLLLNKLIYIGFVYYFSWKIYTTNHILNGQKSNPRQKINEIE